MRLPHAFLSGCVLACGLAAAAAAQDALPYPGDQDSGVYIALRGSLAFAGKDGGVSVPTAPPTALRGAHDIGGGASLVAGFTLPYGFRVEAEGLFRKLPQTTVTLGAVTSPASGFRDVSAPMGNLIWDLPLGDFPVRPFIGGGAGMAYTRTRLQDPSGASVYLTNADWRFAWQGMAGVTVPVAPGARLSAMYRYMRVADVAGKCGTGGPHNLICKGDNSDQSIDLGLEIDLP